MKTTYIYFTALSFMMLYVYGCNRVSETESNFDNVVYIEEAAVHNTKNVIVSAKYTTMEQPLQASLALPTDKDIQVTYKVDFSIVEQYNTINATKCEPLPEEYFELSSNSAVILAGNVHSDKVIVKLKDLDKMPSKDFILPVTLESESGIGILNGSKTLYYRVKKGALIVTAANITQTYLKLVNPATTQNLSGLSQVTLEGLINPHGWGTDANISTIMGIEEYFILRLGDAAWPPEQIQFESAAEYGEKWPPADNSKRIMKDTWTHFALTFDLETREIRMYVNGKVQSRGSRPGTGATVNLSPTTGDPFYIGRSIGYVRDFKGEICEFRIWSVVRTQAEIEASMYGKGLETGMPGLSAWWRFNEGEGNYIYDRSGNGNDIEVGPQEDGTINPLRWMDVELGAENE